ncbi:hydroxypyruvate isomerase family protein [Labrys okinawensis]|uniref:hydroxypyruvate isomerase family protein n=1 Tax=Labrys okinawensis TaxID=346911 RepID=UPI0039BD6761
MQKFSANLGFLWPDRPLLARIDAAAAAGFKAIELHWPYEVPPADLRAANERHGLEMLGINTPIDAAKGEFGLAAVPGRQQDFREGFSRAADYAHAIGARSIHVMAGDVPPERRAEGTQQFLDNLAWAAEQARDLTLLLEPLNKHDRPGYFYSTSGEGAAVIAAAGVPKLKLMFDAYHVGRTEGHVVERLERHSGVIGHVQIAAVPSRAEPDDGEVDYRAFFTALDRLGYSGWVGCEYKPRGDTDEGLRWTETLGVKL